MRTSTRIRRGMRFVISVLLITVSLDTTSNLQAQKRKYKPPKASAALLWRDPGDIAARDLRYGPGSPELAPALPFRFLKEDKVGVSPKFDVEDARGMKWKVKLGEEAQAETVATRLVWAAGYFAEEAYYFDRVRINNLPRLSRGRKYVQGTDTVRGARFEPRRKNIERGPSWDWAKNPFKGTRELDGLRVLMIMLNNWDIKDNNKILYVKNPATGQLESQYTVVDLGAVFGHVSGLGGRRSKNDLKDFQKSRFVRAVDNGVVKFDYHIVPRKLGLFTIFYPPYFFGQIKRDKSMRGIPVEHAIWIGSLLSGLRDEQLRDAFQAAGYDQASINGYTKAIRRRINQLTGLSSRQIAERP